ncbi:hypothetical protein PSAC2689_10677 [Paraburkholderia sacchari]
MRTHEVNILNTQYGAHSTALE